MNSEIDIIQKMVRERHLLIKMSNDESESCCKTVFYIVSNNFSLISFVGESTRLLASLIKNGKSSEIMRNVIRAQAIPYLVTMVTSEHVVMQNEALVALNLICSTVLGMFYFEYVLHLFVRLYHNHN